MLKVQYVVAYILIFWFIKNGINSQENNIVNGDVLVIYLKQEHVYSWEEDKFWTQILIISLVS